jgi:carbamoyltransferase
MPNLAIYASHDASFCVEVNGRYRIFEVERFTQKRYCSLLKIDNWKTVYDKVKELILKEYSVDSFENCYVKHVPDDQLEYLKSIWKVKNIIESGHHESHAACAYYQSPFKECLILSYDGGGRDYDAVSFYNVFYANDNRITRLARYPLDLGTAYGMMGIPISEIKKGKDLLSNAGKLMGLCGYGKVNYPIVNAMIQFFLSGKRHEDDELLEWIPRLKYNMEKDSLKEQESYDLAATTQFVFEHLAEVALKPFLEQYIGMPLCVTGGCALNVLFNEKIKNKYNIEVYVPPNPNDCGLTFGALAWYHPPIRKINTTYSGWGLFDKDELNDYVKKYNGRLITIKEIAQLLNQGKILGIAHGNYECGPRALGNRSIVCDPSKANMKDILNAKVKFREWYRPFAPFVKKENCSKYFDFNGESPFMSFASPVKENYREQLKAVTHIDGTARIQTVTPYTHSFFYDLLGRFEEISGFGVLLNTSFNVKGKPILNTIKECIEVLQTTEIDAVIVEGYIFTK